MIPKHVAIIMDGNRRWAKLRNLSKIIGHQNGAKNVGSIVKVAMKMGIQVLTLYAFSTENWNRTHYEIKALFNTINKYLKNNLNSLKTNRIKFVVIGDIEKLPKSLQLTIKYAMNLTKDNDKFILNIALNYGAKYEIIRAIKLIIKDKIKSEGIDESLFEKYLYTQGLPKVDLLIRTAGEYRLSNFLLWQVAYSEIYTTKILWPDFKEDDLKDAINEYTTRMTKISRRKYGA